MTITHPYVLLSVATSVDGYLDDTIADRLLLSNAKDFDRVDEVRAGVDAILIGATTMRRDNPRLLVNSPQRRAARVVRGLPEYPPQGDRDRHRKPRCLAEVLAPRRRQVGLHRGQRHREGARDVGWPGRGSQ